MYISANPGAACICSFGQCSWLQKPQVSRFRDGLHSYKRRVPRPDDQNKIRKAISARRIDPSDIPETAKTVSSTQRDIPGHSQRKRKATIDDPSASLRSVDLASSNVQGPSHTNPINVDEEPDNEEPQEEETTDELYCTMSTNIVGLQYYNGNFAIFFAQAGDLIRLQVWMDQVKK